MIWHSSAAGLVRRRARGVLGSERGQALIFGALTLFMLAAFVIFIGEAGLVTSSRIEMQNAADECAYAGALYEANIISSVAYLNEAMAYLYYDAVRYAVDTAITGVLASLHHYRVPQFQAPSPDKVYNDADDQKSGYAGDPDANYQDAYQRASTGIDQIERTLNLFARWEWGMALACGEVVEMEMNRVALRHNVEAMAVYPSVRLTQRDAFEFDLEILKHRSETGETLGWRVWTNDTKPPFYIEAIKLGPAHWLITDSKKNSYEIEQTDPTQDHERYHIVTSYPSKGTSEDITIKHDKDQQPGKPWFEQYDFVMKENKPGGKVEETHVIAYKCEFASGWAVSAQDSETSVIYEPFKDGYWISVSNKKTGQSGSAGVRRGPDGKLQQWTGADWADVPGQPDSVTIGGVPVQVQISNKIDLDPSGDHLPEFTVPDQLRINEDVLYSIPNRLELPNVTVVMRPEGVQIAAHVDTPVGRRLSFIVDEANMDKLNLYGLMGRLYVVPDSATCKWFTNREGTERDRLCRKCQLDGDCSNEGPAENETRWTYQFRRGNPYFIKEVPERFAHHAICDRDPDAQANGYKYPQWVYTKSNADGWYDAAYGRPEKDKYWEIRKPWPGGGPPNYDSDSDQKDDAVRIRILKAPDDYAGLKPPVEERQFDPFWMGVEPWGKEAHEVAQKLVALPGPIRLSEDFFYYGLTVGCWRSAQQAGKYPFSLFTNPRWGVVAVASARAGFLETRSDTPDDPAPHYRFTWTTSQLVKQFVEAGYEDLYEPIWTAHLWPIGDAIRDDHIKAYVQNQTGLSYLFTGLLNAIWYEPRPPELVGEEPKRRDDVPEVLKSMNLNPDDPRLGEDIQH